MKTQCRYVIVVDTETSDLISKEKPAFDVVALMEVALVVVDLESLSIIEEKSFIFERDYKEGLIYSSQAEAVHGITAKIQEEKGISLKIIYKEICSLFKKYKNPRQLCHLAGHNIISFDVPFLRNFFEYMGDDLDKYVKFYTDTMLLAHMSALEQENYQLHTCCQINGIDLVNAHRALDDTKANALLFIEYVKRLRGQGSVSQEEKKERKSRFRETFAI